MPNSKRGWWDAQQNGMPRIFGGQRKHTFRKLALLSFVQVAATVGMTILLRHILADSGKAAVGGVGLVDGSALALAAGVFLASTVWVYRVAEDLGQAYVASVRVRLLKNIVLRPISRQPNGWGLTMTRLISDLNGLRNWVALGVARGLSAIVLLAGCIAILVSV